MSLCDNIMSLTDLHGCGPGTQLFHQVAGENGHHAGCVFISVALGDRQLTTAVHHLIEMPRNRGQMENGRLEDLSSEQVHRFMNERR